MKEIKNFMKCLVSLFSLFVISVSLFGERGEVVFEKDDYYIVSTQRGYSVLELWKGCIDIGDLIDGDIERWGFCDIHNLSRSSIARVYVEDYWLDEFEAIDVVFDFTN